MHSQVFLGRTATPRAAAVTRSWLAVLAVSLLVAACGGGDAAAPAARSGTGSVPSYQSTAELLTLPQLKVGSTLSTNVKLRLKKDGSWALESKGTTRAATPADRPAAVLQVAAGASGDLESPQLDATLTVNRLHVGSRVFGSVAVKLTPGRWAFGNSPQETKMLHAEDFRSSATISADESHHVVLKSHPESGVQRVPMRLSARSYRFCMDAQAEGADTMALIAPAGGTVFTLKAGDACTTIQAAAGEYTLEHRYGGKGATRTVFIRQEANVPGAAAPSLARAQGVGASKAATPATAAVSPVAAVRAAAPLVSTGDEYWQVRNPAAASAPINSYLHSHSTTGTACGGELSLEPVNFGAIFPQALLKVEKDVFTGPVALGNPSSCKEAGFGYFITVNFNNPGGGFFPIEFQSNIVVNDGVVQRIPRDTAFFRLASALQIADLSGNQFRLQVDRNPVSMFFNNFRAPTPVIVKGSSVVNGDFPGENIAFGSTLLQAGVRFFPAGLQAPVALDVGQVALFQGANCTGAALVTGDNFAYGLNDLSGVPELAGPFKSIQVGLMTRAFFSRFIDGNLTQFNQLTCTDASQAFAVYDGPGGPTILPFALRIAVDTITIRISTDGCELCNLAGGDFTDIDLTNVKLSGANLANTLLANRDLSGADLRSANLQGAVMSGSNLEGANLCGAQLNASSLVPVAATLRGAHMKNTNLSGAILDGVDFSGASFYSSGQTASCQQTNCSSYVVPSCAGAHGASIQNTNFDSAYIANADMSGVTGRGVIFSGATLFGVSLTGANLAVNATAGSGSKFINANLQGTDFSNANVAYADFTGAQIDLSSSCIQATLSPSFGQFPGSKVPASVGSSNCVAGSQAAPFCVQTSFAAAPRYPATDCTNICADGTPAGASDPRNGSCISGGSCSAASWSKAAGTALPTSNCQGTAQLCGDAFSSTRNLCW